MKIERLFPESALSPEDVADINALIRRLSTRAVPRTAQDISRIATSSEVYLCLLDGRIVGMARLRVDEGFVDRRGHVEDVVRLDDPACKGAGELLMRALHDRARVLGLDSLDLTSSPHRAAAIALYERLGYERRATGVFRRTCK